MNGPLSHIKVLDLSRILAGPWSGQIFADLGADVVKVERLGSGDDTRYWGPPYLKKPDGTETREAGYFLAVNRGKRSITLDLNTPEGQQIVRELAAQSDILLENYKVGNLARFGLSYEDLKEVNPKLIYCSITGFGQTGPKRDHAAYDFMIQAMSGLMSVTGERDDLPGGGPQKVGVPIVDILTGMYACIASLAALSRRAVTGEGEYVDISMLDVTVSSLTNQAMNYLLTGKAPKRAGNKHPNIQPQDVFATQEGHIALAVGNDGQFVKLCNVLGRPDLLEGEQFLTNPSRVEHLGELLSIIKDIFAEKETKYWVHALEEAGVPCAAINNVPEVFAEPQVESREMLINLPHPEAGKVSLLASPMRFKNSPVSYHLPPPLLGQHNEEILMELGKDVKKHPDLFNACGVVTPDITV